MALKASSTSQSVLSLSAYAGSLNGIGYLTGFDRYFAETQNFELILQITHNICS